MLLLVYNEKAGHASVKTLQKLIDEIQQQGWSVTTLSLADENFTQKFQSLMSEAKWLLSFGGDGTLNTVVHYMMQCKGDLPTVIPYPSGTANDFAKYLYGHDFSPEVLSRKLTAGNSTYLDVGKANDQYFINVLGAGLFVDVAYKVDPELKQKIGMWAYWFEAVKRITQYKPVTFSIKETDSGKHRQINGYLLLVLNGRGAGGFSNLAPASSLRDGLLDIVVLKESKSLLTLASLFPKIIQGEHIDDHRVSYFQSSELTLQSKTEQITSVIDGESGPDFPLQISILKEQIPFLCIDDKS